MGELGLAGLGRQVSTGTEAAARAGDHDTADTVIGIGEADGSLDFGP
jgi:hypothetical protein